ncbi:hypothetical protein [Amycolatopsis nigrescens]|uniref:hypothetical protein n=1 Tax=Amycolatopsis nigrescens TaxID=381445 RepID=UPI0003713B2D|nr:hypothetical protein [Amycolatopsis nigrescens]
MGAWLGEYWRLVLLVLTAPVVFVLRGRLPRWVPQAWGLLVAAVALAWLVGLSWPGTLAVFAGLALVASTFWLRGEERRALSRKADDSGR